MKSSTVALLPLVIALTACATNPVTGGREFSLMSEAQEAELGRQSDPEVRAEMGVYDDPVLQRYVQDVGMRLAGGSQRPDLPWQFTIVDVPAVNAFALPGGYIYITRGLMAHLDTEAELAGVLGHEIGHVTARHSARAYTRSATLGIGAAVTSLFFPAAEPYAAAAQGGLGVLFLKYDREQEVQSDRLGAEYVAKQGWAPSGMSGVLETLGRIGAATDRRGVPNWLATHPQPQDRVDRVAATVQTLESARAPSEWTVNRDAYRQRLNGLVFGDNPREGVVRGREFIHPDLRFRVRFPEGWRIENGRRQVAATPPDAGDAAMVLELVPNPAGATLEDVAVGSMTKAGFIPLRGEATRVNGVPAYMGLYEGQTKDATIVRIQAAHIGYSRQVFLLAGIARRSRHGAFQAAFDDVLRSFSPVSTEEAAKIRPNRVAFTTVRPGETWEAVAGRTGGVIRASELAVLNGFGADSQPPAGQRIKIVIGSE